MSKKQPYGIIVFYPVRLISEPNQRGNWRVHNRRRKEHRIIGRQALVGQPVDKANVRRVVITRCAPRLLDSDNAVGSAKSLRDGIADYLGRGDGPECGIDWVVEQEKRKGYSVRIEVFT